MMDRLCRGVRALLIGSLVALGATALLAGIGVGFLLAVLTPAPGEWQQRVSLGPFSSAISVPALIRMITHPLAARLIDGRSIDTTMGRWHWQATSDGPIVGTCAPCRLHIKALGTAPLTLEAVRLQVQRAGAQRLGGELALGGGTEPLVLPWQATLSARSLEVDFRLAAVPMARVVQVFGHDLPEAGRVQVDGSLALSASAAWPAGTWRVVPQLEGLAVHGLGTEQFLAVQLPAACRANAVETPVGGWLPRAVIAAEDQRFFEHAGFDLTEMLAAWHRNQAMPGTPHGASTITQQLAKRLVTGDDRSATRKLRELLYAVEMERTLGKGRILQLYLALAPWGPGVCGGAQAARVHVGREVDQLGPVAAAWLASLLTQPDAQLQSLAEGQAPDAVKIERILRAMRPMPREARERALSQLPAWRPAAFKPVVPRPASAGAPATPAASCRTAPGSCG